MSLLLTLDIFHILRDVKNAVIRALYWKERKKSKFNRLQIEVLFLPSIRSPVYKPPLPPSPHPRQYRPIKFVLSPYMRPGRIDEILRWKMYADI